MPCAFVNSDIKWQHALRSAHITYKMPHRDLEPTVNPLCDPALPHLQWRSLR